MNSIPYFGLLPLPVQSQIRVLIKPRKQRTEADIKKVKMTVKQIEFFRSKNLDDKVLSQIVASAGFQLFEKHDWVFRDGDEGDNMYVILHGEACVIIQNKDFFEYRRTLREQVQEYYDRSGELLDFNKKFRKVSAIKNPSKYMDLLKEKLPLIKSVISIYQEVKKSARKFNKIKKMICVKRF